MKLFINIFAAVVMQVSILGCTIMHKVHANIPIMHTGSPLKDVSPRVFALKMFIDTRGKNPTEFTNNLGAHEYKLDKPVNTIVTQSICKELERNGHVCILFTTESKQNFIVDGLILDYWLDNSQLLGYFKVKATVAAKLTIISDFNTENSEFIKSYKGEYIYKMDAWKMNYGPTYDEIMQQALKRMLSEISTDDELVTFITMSNTTTMIEPQPQKPGH